MAEQDKHGHKIEVGDHVSTKFRGGHREGDVRSDVFSLLLTSFFQHEY
jgi:hypothetical protein